MYTKYIGKFIPAGMNQYFIWSDILFWLFSGWHTDNEDKILPQSMT